MKRVVIGVACCGPPPPPPPPPRLHPRLFRSPVPFHSAVGSSRGSPRLPPGSPGFASTRSIVFYYGRLGHSNPPLFVVPFPMRTPHESHSTSSRFFFSRDFSRRLILADFFSFLSTVRFSAGPFLLSWLRSNEDTGLFFQRRILISDTILPDYCLFFSPSIDFFKPIFYWTGIIGSIKSF